MQVLKWIEGERNSSLEGGEDEEKLKQALQRSSLQPNLNRLNVGSWNQETQDVDSPIECRRCSRGRIKQEINAWN